MYLYIKKKKCESISLCFDISPREFFFIYILVAYLEDYLELYSNITLIKKSRYITFLIDSFFLNKASDLIIYSIILSSLRMSFLLARYL